MSKSKSQLYKSRILKRFQGWKIKKASSKQGKPSCTVYLITPSGNQLPSVAGKAQYEATAENYQLALKKLMDLNNIPLEGPLK